MPDPAELRSRVAATVSAADGARTTQELEAAEAAALGRSGYLTAALRTLSYLPAEERPARGRQLHALRQEIEQVVARRRGALATAELEARLAAERLDLTLPAPLGPDPRLHPLTRTRREAELAFMRLGFSIARGPEVELESLSFDRLGIPPDHPAREMQDSFYPQDLPGRVLRPHTSPVQIRAMEAARGRLPLRIICPGRVFRRDDDATHSPNFFQIEGLAVDRGLSLADLKGVLAAFSRAMFGPHTAIRLRPSYFPFTEPSVEVDVTCFRCGGAGCRVCGDGWLEILGAGMVHPDVLREGGYDPEEVSGFACGIGIERVAMLRYGVPDIRFLYGNDLQYLEQFGSIDVGDDQT
jgi:phenylalanyl-tRNA synthetase alpha chain